MATAPMLATPFEPEAARSVTLHSIDPLTDLRWEELASTHPNASAFHQKGWLRALTNTYGYRPVVLTSAAAGQRLQDGIVFCEVQSWITGSRLVSLPFSDHCEPLLNKNGNSLDLTQWLPEEHRQRNWKYIELRPLPGTVPPGGRLVESQSFWFHTLDLTPSREQIFDGFHKNSIQRRIRKAEREHLSYETGCSEQLLDDFCRLLLITRRRHGWVPQPRAWFRNLIRYMSPNIQIRVARKEGIAIAAILTLRHRNTVVYKYGCSDDRFHHLAGMPFLFWKLIEESKTNGAGQIDFGRSDLDNEGLITFKDRFGATRIRLTYFRYPEDIKGKNASAVGLSSVRRLFSVLPDGILSAAGHLIYRHIG